MIRKSVETRDWLNTIEPRNIRSVMKRVVEEVTVIDKQVGTLYEDGAKKDQGSGETNSKVYMYTFLVALSIQMYINMYSTFTCKVIHVHV